MNKILSILLTPIFFILFGLTLIIFHLPQVIAKNLINSRAHDRVVAILNLCLMRSQLVLGATFKFVNFEDFPTGKPVIVVANHQSMWDIPPLIWKFRKNRLKFIAKKELAKGIPSISYNLKHGGSVTIDRKNPDESIELIKNFAIDLNVKKFAVCIYPEGSRSKDGKVKPFKVGGLKALIEQMPDAVVVPVAIDGTGKIDNKGSFFLNLGVSVVYTALKPRQIQLETIEYELEQIREEIIELVEK